VLWPSTCLHLLLFVGARAVPLHELEAKVQDVHVCLVQQSLVPGDLLYRHALPVPVEVQQSRLVLLRFHVPEPTVRATLHDPANKRTGNVLEYVGYYKEKIRNVNCTGNLDSM